MEAVNIANSYEEAYEENEWESLLLSRSASPEEILQPENDPLRFCKGLLFALAISLLIWGVIIRVFL